LHNAKPQCRLACESSRIATNAACNAGPPLTSPPPGAKNQPGISRMFPAILVFPHSLV
jgi:hypothetical protein